MLRTLLWQLATLGVLVVVAPPRANAATWMVNPDGSGDALTIQAGLALSSSGDSVVVACGIYREFQLIMKSGVTLTSATGQPDCVTIDAEGRGRVFKCLRVFGGEIIGFTVTGGSATYGGGIFTVSLSTPRIANCVFTGNRALVGGGAYFHHSPLVVENCVFSNNHADYFGGGVAIEDFSDPSFLDTEITDNTAASHGGGVWSYLYSNPALSGCRLTGNSSGGAGGGLHSMAAGTAGLDNCLISGNLASQGGAVGVWASGATLTSCTVTGNSAATTGGGLLADLGAVVNAEQTILWGNCAADGREVHTADTGSLVEFTCSDADSSSGAMTGAIPPVWTGTNFSADPLFCDGVSCGAAPSSFGNFELGSASPCLAGQTGGCGLIGALPQGACSRATATIRARSWGQVKALYRDGDRQ